MLIPRVLWVFFFGSVVLGCADESGATNGAAHNAAGGGGAVGTTGGAGGASGSGAQGGSSNGSVTATGGSASVPAGTGGMSGTGGAAGMSGTGGAAGMSGTGGAAEGGPLPKPSAGCGKTAGPVGERQMSVAARTGLYIVSLPPNYDMAKAYPLGFAFHGRNRNHKNCQDGDCAGFQTVMGGEAVLVYMQSLREPLDSDMGGWEGLGQAEREDNSKFFEQVLAQVKADYCVDEQRVFVAGTSSGASFSNLLGCRYGDQLLAVAPVSGGLPESQNCKGTPAAIVIHGIDDPHVPFASGEAARANYLARAACSDTTVPLLADMHAEIRTKRDAQPSVEAAACVDYQGCAAPSQVRWCEHSYGGYDGSTHGWPPPGGQMIWDFVKAL